MSRVSETPTWELWGISQSAWLYQLQTTGRLQMMIDHYNGGINLMEAANRDLVGSHKYADLTKKDLVLIGKRNSTIDFYRKRLAELGH